MRGLTDSDAPRPPSEKDLLDTIHDNFCKCAQDCEIREALREYRAAALTDAAQAGEEKDLLRAALRSIVQNGLHDPHAEEPVQPQCSCVVQIAKTALRNEPPAAREEPLCAYQFYTGGSVLGGRPCGLPRDSDRHSLDGKWGQGVRTHPFTPPAAREEDYWPNRLPHLDGLPCNCGEDDCTATPPAAPGAAEPTACKELVHCGQPRGHQVHEDGHDYFDPGAAEPTTPEPAKDEERIGLHRHWMVVNGRWIECDRSGCEDRMEHRDALLLPKEEEK